MLFSIPLFAVALKGRANTVVLTGGLSVVGSFLYSSAALAETLPTPSNVGRSDSVRFVTDSVANRYAPIQAQIQYAQTPGPQVASAEEILAEVNRLRTSPADYAAWLTTLRPYYEGTALRLPGERGIRTIEGVTALDGAIAALSSRQPQSPLTLAPGLVLSTQDHLSELLTTQRFTLAGVDGSSPLTRAQRYGELEGGHLHELLNEGFSSAEAIVAALVIDDGNRSRTTQDALMNSDVTTLAAACGVGGNEKPLCVVDYATHYVSHEVIDTADTTVAQSMPVSEIALEDFVEGSVENSLEESIWSGALTQPVLASLADELIVETNLLRADPAAYAQKLIALRDYYEGNLVKVPGQPVIEVVEGVAALNEAIAALQETPSLTTLSASAGMENGARDHAYDLGSKGLTGHYGSDNSDPFERISRYGSWDQNTGNVAGENISYGQAALAEWHIIQLLIDDNVPDRGHREALLRPDYRRMGAACEVHPDYRLVCVMTYASDYQENR